MGGQKKQHICLGLLPHVGAGRCAPPKKQRNPRLQRPGFFIPRGSNTIAHIEKYPSPVEVPPLTGPDYCWKYDYMPPRQ